MPASLVVAVAPADWLANTRLDNKPRSALLGRIDKALTAYHEAGQSDEAFVDLRQAFVRWERSRAGKDPSARDATAYVSKLRSQIEAVDADRLARLSADDPAQAQALADLRAMVQSSLHQVFDGKTMAWRNATGDAIKDELAAAKSLREASKQIKKVVDGSASASAGPKDAEADAATEHVTRSVFGGVDAQGLFDQLGLGPVEVFKESVGALFKSVGAPLAIANQVRKVAQQLWRRRAISSEVLAFRSGDPETAVRAVKALLTREVTASTVKLAQMSAKLTADLASGGVAVALTAAASAVVDVMFTVMRAAYDHEQIAKGRALLDAGSVDMTAFETCPLLGCHYLLVAGDGVVLDWAHSDLGASTFDSSVMALKAEAAPVIKMARQYVADARIVVVDAKAPGADALPAAIQTVRAAFERGSASYRAEVGADEASTPDARPDGDRHDPGAAPLGSLIDHAGATPDKPRPGSGGNEDGHGGEDGRVDGAGPDGAATGAEGGRAGPAVDGR